MFLILVSLWDMFTTGYGTWKLLYNARWSVPVSAAVAVVVWVYMWGVVLMQRAAPPWRFPGCLAYTSWIIAALYDAFTSFIGHANLMLGDSLWNANSPLFPGGLSLEQYLILYAITFIVSGTSIFAGLFLARAANFIVPEGRSA